MRTSYTITREYEYLGQSVDSGQVVLTLGDPRYYEVELRVDQKVWARIVDDYLFKQGRALRESRARLAPRPAPLEREGSTDERGSRGSNDGGGGGSGG